MTALNAVRFARRLTDRLTTAPAPGAALPNTVLRLRLLGCVLVLYYLAFLQDPGRISRDTKLDLYVDPGRFMARAMSLWDDSSAFGQLQNQAYGYLFPMGPFFWVTHVLGLEPWVAQRLWMGSLMSVAFLGIYVLAGRLSIGTPLTRAVAAFAFALTPRLAITLGPISSESLALCVSPWVLVPLVSGARTGSVRRSAAWSGVAIACAGAVNAVATIAILPLPFLYLLTRSRGPRRRGLLLWWSLATLLATLWWIVPLALLGSYSFPFLNYIETAQITTAETSLVEVLRGGSHWLGGLVAEGAPWWRAGWLIETAPFVVLGSVVVAALGLVGAARPDNPERLFLMLGITTGCVLVGFGYGGPVGPLLASHQRELLDGALAPFRNVHKFDLVLRVPLVLGMAHLLTAVRRPPFAYLVKLGAVCAIVITALPFLVAQVEPTGGYRSIPTYWTQAAAWLGHHAGRESTLLLPAAGFGEYYWGRPMDDPMQPLAQAPWAVRNQVPLGSEGNTRLLDAVQAVVTSGRGSPGLAQVLARSGVGFVLVRNDLDYARTGAPPPAVIHQALDRSPGFTRVASFGPGVAANRVGNQQVSDYGLDALNPAIEIYRVQLPVFTVNTYDASRTTALVGGPESLLGLADDGLLAGRFLSLDGDPLARGVQSRSVVITDDFRKRERNFGTVYDGASATLTDADPSPAGDPRDLLPWPGVARAAARWTGVADVQASSSASDTDAFVLRGAEYSPAAALDGNSDSAWVSGAHGDVSEQWFELRLKQPTALSRVTVRMLDTAVFGTRLTALRVVTDRGHVTTRLQHTESPQQLRVPAGKTSRVRLEVAGVRRLRPGPAAIGLREVSLPGIAIGHPVVVPVSASGLDTDAVLMSSTPGERWGCARSAGVSACSPRLPRLGEEEGPLDRIFTVPNGWDVTFTGSAVPIPGPALTAVLRRAAGMTGLTVSATSTLVTDPSDAPDAVLDGDLGTTWVAAHEDRHPALRLRWSGPRTIGSLQITHGATVSSRPTSVVIETDGGRRRALVDADGWARFPEVRATRMTLTFPSPEPVFTADPRDHNTALLPVGVTELRVPALMRRYGDWDSATPLRLPCGQGGPTVLVDGHPVLTEAIATLGDFRNGRAVMLRGCEPLHLSEGQHRLVSTPSSVLGPDRLSLIGDAVTRQRVSVTQFRAVGVARWSATARSVNVGAGGKAVLTVAENFNAGWSASLGGRALRPMRMDGWQQGFLLPAGPAGQVKLVFGPNRVYRGGLVGGLGALLLLCGLAVMRARPDLRSPAIVGRARRSVRIVGLAGLVGATGAIGGVVVGLVVSGVLVVARLTRRRPAWRAQRRLDVVAGAVLIGCAVLVAMHVGGEGLGLAATSGQAQVLALGAVALAWLSATDPDD